MEDTKPKPFVFVLMPFSEDFDDVYELGIKAACKNAGAYAIRVDEQIFKESILERIYMQIDKADIIVADMTGKNQNVFYETGYAHALGKHVIFLTQNKDDIPFDLQHYPHIIYSGKIKNLLPELEKRVRWAIDNPKTKEYQRYFSLKFFIDGNELSNNPTIKYLKKPGIRLQRLYLGIDVNNSINKYIESSQFKILFITSNRFGSSILHSAEKFSDYSKNNIIKLSKNNNVHVINQIFKILPGAWLKIPITFNATDISKFLNDKDKEKFILRISTETDTFDYPYIIKVVEENP